jgi:hypothetical protein
MSESRSEGWIKICEGIRLRKDPQSIVKVLFTLLAIALSEFPVYAEEVSIKNLSGARIDDQWFRYINLRFGLAIDIPTTGYKYEIPVNGSGLTLTPPDRTTVITIYAHWVVNVVDSANNDVRRSVARLFDNAISETLQKGGAVEYSTKKDDFYVVSGRFGKNMFYERLVISATCPAIFNSFRIFHPAFLERTLDPLVTRMSNSLAATCKGEDGAAFIK